VGSNQTAVGVGNQTAIKSWFPLATTFEGSGEDYGRWTPVNEKWFLDRVDAIKRQKKGWEPLPAGKWRDLMRGLNDGRQLKKQSLALAQDFVQNVPSDGHH
jgi:hypothetical protein